MAAIKLDSELESELGRLKARIVELEARVRRSHRGGREPGSSADVLLVGAFGVDGAFELSRVREVVPAAELARLPEAPTWVLGTLNLRGVTLPVIDLGARLGQSSGTLELTDLIVVVSTEFGAAGLVVDEVGMITTVRLDTDVSLRETPHAGYVVGTFSHGGGTRLLFGIEELVTQVDLASVFAAGGGAG